VQKHKNTKKNCKKHIFILVFLCRCLINLEGWLGFTALAQAGYVMPTVGVKFGNKGLF